MSFDFNAKVQQNGITKEQFIQKMVKYKIKEDKAASIFEQFNSNQAASNVDGKQTQVLDQNEQVGLMAFFKQLAGGDNEDTNITRKDFKHNKGDAGAIENGKYKDYKRAMQAFQELLSDNNKTNNDDANVKFNKDGTITTQGENEEVTTNYNLDKNKVTHSEKSDGSRTQDLEYTDGHVSTDTVEEMQDGVQVTTVNGKKTKTLEEKDGKTITTHFGDEGGVRQTDDPQGHTVTYEEFSGDEPKADNISRTTVIDTQGKTATVQEGNTTTKYEDTVDKDNLGTVVETTVVDGDKTVNTNLKTHTRTTSDSSDNSVKTEYMKGDNSTLTKVVTEKGDTTKTDFYNDNGTALTKSVTKQGDTTQTEFYNSDGSSVSRAVTQDKSKITFNDGGNESSFKLDENGNFTTYAKYENGRYETLDQAAKRLGFEEGTDEYNSFVAANGGKAGGYLKAGQALKVGADIATSPSFNVDEAKTDRQTQIDNWRAANPEKAAAAAAKRQGIQNLRQTFATKDFQIYYDPSGEKSGRIDGQGKTGGTHYIYQNGKLTNLEDYVKSKGVKFAEGEHIIRVTEDGTVRTNKNQYYKLDGSKSDVQSYNRSFKAGHAATGGEIKDVSGKTLAKTKVTQETGTPESKQFKQLTAQYNNARAAFDQQMKKDGWAADVADGIAHLWNNGLIELTGNTADMVRRDLDAYKNKLDQMQAALDKDDMATFRKLQGELNQMDIASRIAAYNESQDDGAAAVKTGVVVVASSAAAIATGGSSLVVQAGVAGAAAAAARVGAEVSDLASNDIDGDINKQSLGQIAEQAVVDGAVTAVTVGIARGVGDALTASARTAASGADDVGSAIVRSASNGADDVGSAIARSASNGADDVGSAIVRSASNGADDVGGAIVRSASSGADDVGSAIVRSASNTADDVAGAAAKGATQGAAQGAEEAAAKAAEEAAAKAAEEAAAKAAEEAAAKAAEEAAAKAAEEAAAKAAEEAAAKAAEEAAAKAAAQAAANEASVMSKFGISAQDVEFLRTVPSSKSSWTPAIRSKIADILGIRASDVGNLSKAQFRELLIKFHPDRNGGAQIAEELTKIIQQMR